MRIKTPRSNDRSGGSGWCLSHTSQRRNTSRFQSRYAGAAARVGVDGPQGSPATPWRWGDPRIRYPARGRARLLAYLTRTLGGTPPRPARPSPPSSLPDPRLSEDDLTDLARLVGPGALFRDDRSRRSASTGGSYRDVALSRAGSISDGADAVIEPASLPEVEAVVGWADSRRVALVPRGGGTSVVGGLEPRRNGLRAVVSVSLGRLRRAGPVDRPHRLATFEAGILGPELEASLRRSGWTLGHFPQSFERSSLGGWIVTRSFGQASTRYLTPVDRLEAFEIVTPRGRVAWRRSERPASAPDPGEIVPGSEGVLGILVSATLRVEPIAERTGYFAAVLPDWDAGVETTRRLAIASPAPAVLRLSDGPETDLTLAESGWEAGGRREPWRRLAARGLRFRKAPDGETCLLIGSYEGASSEVDRGRSELRSALRAARAAALPSMVGRAWERGRFLAPYLRDDLIENGWFVETFETFARWEGLSAVLRAARTAVVAWAGRQGVPAMVGTHLSHPTAEGTAAYFTVLAFQVPDRIDPAARAFKEATAEAVVRAGGTVTHHHGIGTYHRAWVRRSFPPGWLEGLRTLKARWDPNGIMNPGKTMPED